jgi:2-haloalkanoic acid dehalogenase type II
MSAITTVIFDMFNTIAQDGADLWQRTFAAIIEEQQLNTTPEELRHAWDYGAGNFRDRRTAPGAPFISYLDGWAHAFATAFTELNVPGDAMAASQRSIDDLGTRPLFPEAVDALSILSQTHQLAVISNADDAYLDPVAARIPTNLGAVISSEAVQCYKPDRRLFDAAVERLKVQPAECAYVGDRQFEDVMGSRAVGMAAIWINRSGHAADPDLPTPDAEIRDLLELPDILAKIGQEMPHGGTNERG